LKLRIGPLGGLSAAACDDQAPSSILSL
jgi:hypothetical protein